MINICNQTLILFYLIWNCTYLWNLTVGKLLSIEIPTKPFEISWSSCSPERQPLFREFRWTLCDPTESCKQWEKLPPSRQWGRWDRWALGWRAGVCPMWTHTPRWRGGASPTQKRDHIFLILEGTHTQRTLRYAKHRLRTRQSKMVGQRKLRRNALYKWFKLPRGYDSVSEPTRVCIHRYSFYPPNKHLFLSVSFLQTGRAKACLWLLVPGSLVPGFQSFHSCSLTSNSGQELNLCLKLLQAKDTQDQHHTWDSSMSHQKDGLSSRVAEPMCESTLARRRGGRRNLRLSLCKDKIILILNPYIPFTEKHNNI